MFVALRFPTAMERVLLATPVFSRVVVLSAVWTLPSHLTPATRSAFLVNVVYSIVWRVVSPSGGIAVALFKWSIRTPVLNPYSLVDGGSDSVVSGNYTGESTWS